MKLIETKQKISIYFNLNLETKQKLKRIYIKPIVKTETIVIIHAFLL